MNKNVIAFRDAVTVLSLANAGRRGWWYTWLASRDRFRYGLFSAFLGCDASGAAMRRGSGVVKLAKEIAAALQGRIEARRHPVSAPSATTVLIVAPASNAALKMSSGPYHDTYFGPLFETLRSDGDAPMLVGIPVTDRRATIAALAQRSDIPATSLYHWVRFGDLLRALVEALATRLACPPLRLPSGANAAPMVRAEVGHMKAEIFLGLVVERAMRRLLEACPSARVVHTYENNPWERAVDRAAHEVSPRRHVVGYLHCAVLPSHLKYYIAPEEKGLRPEPDLIVCSGPAARDVFLGLGHHDPDRVAAGCALRDPSLSVTNARTGPVSIRTLLVLLEALMSMDDLIRFLEQAGQHIGQRRILLRAHPVLPLPVLLEHAGIVLDPDGGLEESRQLSLDNAIEEADAVIYVSSTAAMKALAMGRPLIKVKLDEFLEDDPLFACDALKRVVRRPEELETAIRSLESMTRAGFEGDLRRAKDYLAAYMTPPDTASLSPFRKLTHAVGQTTAPNLQAVDNRVDSRKT